MKYPESQFGAGGEEQHPPVSQKEPIQAYGKTFVFSENFCNRESEMWRDHHSNAEVVASNFYKFQLAFNRVAGENGWTISPSDEQMSSNIRKEALPLGCSQELYVQQGLALDNLFRATEMIFIKKLQKLSESKDILSITKHDDDFAISAREMRKIIDELIYDQRDFNVEIERGYIIELTKEQKEALLSAKLEFEDHRNNPPKKDQPGTLAAEAAARVVNNRLY